MNGWMSSVPSARADFMYGEDGLKQRYELLLQGDGTMYARTQRQEAMGDLGSLD
jgi:hypothetical protein